MEILFIAVITIGLMAVGYVTRMFVEHVQSFQKKNIKPLTPQYPEGLKNPSTKRRVKNENLSKFNKSILKALNCKK